MIMVSGEAGKELLAALELKPETKWFEMRVAVDEPVVIRGEHYVNERQLKHFVKVCTQFGKAETQ